MNPVYQQLLSVIGVILFLGGFGILRAWQERLVRKTESSRLAENALLLVQGELNSALTEEIRARRSRAEAELAAQHDLEHK